ncbi:MAG: PRC-barrel domain-containing protein [Anaerolineales bacterium]|nr:PRC-barrel domain-containing protein [Anaerolineales bacterium]
MDIPLNVDVFCSNEQVCGRSVCIILNPVTKEITHFVVRTKEMIHLEYLVPVEFIVESTPHKILLRCSRHQLAQFRSFTHVEYLDPVDVDYEHLPTMYEPGGLGMWPYGVDNDYISAVPVEDIPHGELGVHRGAHVEARDGRIGRVDEFLVNPENSHITHLVLREGHLWGQKDVTIPISEIDRIADDVVYLKLDKQTIAQMPGISIKRWWR